MLSSVETFMFSRNKSRMTWRSTLSYFSGTFVIRFYVPVSGYRNFQLVRSVSKFILETLFLKKSRCFGISLNYFAQVILPMPQFFFFKVLVHSVYHFSMRAIANNSFPWRGLKCTCSQNFWIVLYLLDRALLVIYPFRSLAALNTWISGRFRLPYFGLRCTPLNLYSKTRW